MLDLAREYMQRIEITDTQYFVVRHTDMKHPHLHILYNRVRYNTILVSDRNERLHNMRICKDLKQVYGLTFSRGKEQLTTEYFIEILHQTTTPRRATLQKICCILLKFYIKPQQ